ncbi:MAG: hydrogenase nickel incorporation protein HypB [Anaerolineaceae bacterium]|nr:hydrogenase nickel incorporation protein HypB [Anaerolineaceae bacterium]
MGKSTKTQTIPVKTRILSENDRLAAENRAWFVKQGIFVVNLISSPGSGKTTLLVDTLNALKGKQHCAVIEGDQQTSLDANRIAETGFPVRQVNTGRACHLDASMIKNAVSELAVTGLDILFIENVGNLICPAEFDLGEHCKVVLMSVTEGEDKPLKYPVIFHLSRAVVMTKMDLIPHLRYDPLLAEKNIRKINPQAVILRTSTYTSDGLQDWLDWLVTQKSHLPL